MLLFLSLCACFVSDAELDAAYDRDDDGYQPAQNGGKDCDNEDPDIHPGALELCDGVDNNCNGVIDEIGAVDGLVFYADGDEDGYGVESDTIKACERPAAYSTEDGDCDPDDPTFNPGATDLCDGQDQDCDGVVDSDASFSSWYLDYDQDGFGDPAIEVVACSAPSGHVGNDEDCDDSQASIRPGQTDICDGADEDCDGEIDEDAEFSTWYADLDGDGAGDPAAVFDACEQPPDTVAVAGDCDDSDPLVIELTWYADGDGDGFGNPAVFLEQCAGPSGWVLDGSDCDDVDEFVNPGEPEVCGNGVDDDCDFETACGAGDNALTANERFFVNSQLGAQAGTAVALGDLDGDGVVDFVVGAPNYDFGGQIDRGAAHIVFGPHPGGEVDLNTETDANLAGEASGWDTAGVMAVVGDIDGDGTDDLIVGADDSDAGGGGSGAVYLVLGPRNGYFNLGFSDVRWIGVDGSSFGARAGGGLSVDGDADPDIFVTANKADHGNGESGAVYVFSGPNPSSDIASATAVLFGENPDDAAGLGVAMADISGDGLADMLVGAPGTDVGGVDWGAAYLVEGPVSGQLDLAMADSTMRGETDDQGAGFFLDAGVDIDADGYLDSVVSGDATATAGGESVGDVAVVVHVAEDVNGDGFGEVVVGAPNVGGDEGAVYVLYGPLQGGIDLGLADSIYRSEVGESSHLGMAIDSRDVDGDNLVDLLLGAPGYDGVFAAMSGGAYLVLGAGI